MKDDFFMRTSNLFKIVICMITALFFGNSFAALVPKIESYKWNDVDVFYIEDSRVPLFDIAIYYGEGALLDTLNSGTNGSVSMSFSMLDGGTDQLTNAQISESLELHGASFSTSVDHEYSTISLKGPTSDLQPITKLFCQMMSKSTFPESELKIRINNHKEELTNLVNNPRALSTRSLRAFSLAGTPYGYPADGKLADLDQLTSAMIKSKHELFNRDVYKRIYLYGPREVLNIKDIVTKECGILQGRRAVSKLDVNLSSVSKGPKLYLVTTPGANQAQIGLGRFIGTKSVGNQEVKSLVANYLGGGFSSLLMQKLRVEKGLTYSVSAFAQEQRDYGRAGIMTFTKNESVLELLKNIHEIVSAKAVDEKRSNFARSSLSGSFPFEFENVDHYLQRIIYLDHVRVDLKRFINFPQIVSNISDKDLMKEFTRLYSWDELTIIVVGNPSLEKELQTIAPVTVISSQSVL